MEESNIMYPFVVIKYKLRYERCARTTYMLWHALVPSRLVLCVPIFFGKPTIKDALRMSLQMAHV